MEGGKEVRERVVDEEIKEQKKKKEGPEEEEEDVNAQLHREETGGEELEPGEVGGEWVSVTHAIRRDQAAADEERGLCPCVLLHASEPPLPPPLPPALRVCGERLHV